MEYMYTGDSDGQFLDVDVRRGDIWKVGGPHCVEPVIEAEGSAGSLTGITVDRCGRAGVLEAAAVGRIGEE